MSRLTRTLLLVLTCLAAVSPCQAATHHAAHADELAAICRTIQPGDTIVLEDGTYADQELVFTGTGTPQRPITLRAATPGRVVLNGTSTLAIAGTHLVVDGLLFKGGAIRSESVIAFRHNDTVARHCTLRNSAIVDYNPHDPETRYFWVSLFGSHHTVEHCDFSGQNHSGVTLCVRLGDEQPGHHVIRRNHFANRPRGEGNGFETIRIGTGGHREVVARCRVAENLFERCDGELEIVSNKSCENTYENNTFLRSAGTLTLRQGDRCKVIGNVFIGDDAEDTGGLRVTGRGHEISGNYFSGIRGSGGAAISILAGTDTGLAANYSQVIDCVLDANTLVDNPGPLFALDTRYSPDRSPHLARGVTITNTLMVARPNAGPILRAKQTPTGITWRDNVAVFEEGLEPDELPDGIRVVSEVPADWRARLKPEPLTPRDVGPAWRRQ